MTSMALGLALALTARFRGADFVPNGPAVLRAQEPVYADAARKARMEGFSVVDLQIGEDGCVIQAEAQGTNPLLAGAGTRAAEEWLFAAEPGSGIRCATLVFEFVLNEAGSEEAFQAIDSTSPHSMRVAAVVQPANVVRIECNLENYERLVDADPWSTRFGAKILEILPLR